MWSIAAGFLVVVVLSIGIDAILHAAGIFPELGKRMSDGLFILATIYRTVFGVLGSYITARLAPGKPMKHTMIGAAIGTVLATAGAVATWNRGSRPALVSACADSHGLPYGVDWRQNSFEPELSMCRDLWCDSRARASEIPGVPLPVKRVIDGKVCPSGRWRNYMRWRCDSNIELTSETTLKSATPNNMAYTIKANLPKHVEGSKSQSNLEVFVFNNLGVNRGNPVWKKRTVVAIRRRFLGVLERQF